MASVLAAVDGGEITNGPAPSAWAMPSKTRRLLPPDAARGPPLARPPAWRCPRRADTDGRAQERAKKTAMAAEKKSSRTKARGGGGGRPNRQGGRGATNRATASGSNSA